MKAEALLMHPNQYTIACRATAPTGAAIVQVYDFAAKKKLKQCQLSEKIEFWNWINDTTLGIITSASVYHLDLNAAGETVTATKIFDRDARLTGAHIMGYNVDDSGKWCFVHGIASNEAKQITGVL